ncbi:MAG TPA: 5-formyltetrahydrofolate cyclo-ligase [Candidatus Bathyarchaeia archaeon]|nr:5-formyltetrahydrofolate cyclo-ligase [Candidatus Bathyarchaeia archaeon]
MLTLLKNQKEEDRLRKSSVIQEKLFHDPDFERSKTVLFYASFSGEVETFGAMRQAMMLGKRVGLPIVNVKKKTMLPRRVTSLEDDLEYGPYTIKQPKGDSTKEIDLSEIDLVLVPALAFDRQGYRLGRGAGYYDRFLESFPHIPHIGLAFDFQILDRLPVEPHDRPVTKIISN